MPKREEKVVTRHRADPYPRGHGIGASSWQRRGSRLPSPEDGKGSGPNGLDVSQSPVAPGHGRSPQVAGRASINP
jgi:hypothetical protein